MNTLPPYLALPAVAVRTAIVLAGLVLGIRLAGKRHIGEMAVDDILLILMTANAVQNAMTTGSGRVSVAFVCAGTLIAAGWLGGVVFSRFPFLERRVSGAPTLLVHDGVAIRRNLRREHVSRDQLMLAVRKQGLGRVADVKLAVLEANGAISVVPRDKGAGAE